MSAQQIVVQTTAATFHFLVAQGANIMKDIGDFMQNLVYGDTGIRVEVKEGRGRCVVANKQLEVGDVIIEERSVAWGPKQLSPCCCLACCAPLNYTEITWCSLCGLPLCQQDCPLIAKHSPECELMRHAKHMLILNSERDVQQVYYFVTVLRCLWLRAKNPAQWSAVKKLVSNVQYRKGTKVYNFNQTYVVDILDHFGVVEFSEEEIQDICGIFDSNAFESSESSRVPCRGLYLMASLMNSSCLPNTRHYFKPDGRIVVVATRPIYPGAEILACYTQPRWGTGPRHKHLQTTKYFRFLFSQMKE